MDRFEVIDTSGDVGIRAFGTDLESLFANAASGMYDLITSSLHVREEKTLEVRAEGRSIEGLLVAWLNELIFEFDTNGFTGKIIEIKELAGAGLKEGEKGGFSLKALVTGEEFDQSRHERRLLVKAATYHKLRIEKKDGLYEADIIFDI